MRDITSERYENGSPKLRRFHQARWDESIIFELSTPGQRGILPPEVEDGIKARAGNPAGELPDSLRRSTPPALNPWALRRKFSAGSIKDGPRRKTR